MVLPIRYFSGLSTRKRTQRKKEIEKRSKLSWKNPRAYRPFLTDKNVVIKNDTTNIMIQKTKRYLIDNKDTVDFKYLTKVA